MPALRNVSMTCPFRKKAEKTLQAFLFRGEAFEGVMNDEGSAERRESGAGPGPYGFVNMVPDAPSVQRIMCGRMYIRAGRIPHVRGSSSLEASYRQPHMSMMHVGRMAATAFKIATMYKQEWRTPRDGYRLEKPHVRNNLSRDSRGKK